MWGTAFSWNDISSNLYEAHTKLSLSNQDRQKGTERAIGGNFLPIGILQRNLLRTARLDIHPLHRLDDSGTERLKGFRGSVVSGLASMGQSVCVLQKPA